MEMKMIVRTGWIFMRRAGVLSIAAAALFLAGCASQSPVQEIAVVDSTPSVSPDRRLSLQGTNSALYQHTSAEVHLLFKQCYELALHRFEMNYQATDDTSLAVVVDVDETVLDNSRYELEQLANGTTFTPETWNEWVQRREATPVPGAKGFLTHVAEKGCEVFYITNRSAEEKSATIYNLRRFGFPFADSTHVLTRDATSDKTERRGKVETDHTVLLYVGDQLRDYSEKMKDRSEGFGKGTVDSLYSELSTRFVLTPNSVYGTWKDRITGKGSAEEKNSSTELFLQEYRR